MLSSNPAIMLRPAIVLRTGNNASQPAIVLRSRLAAGNSASQLAMLSGTVIIKRRSGFDTTQCRVSKGRNV